MNVVKHSNAKKIEHFLIGFDPESKEWISLLSETFYDIYLHYNYQFTTILQHPTDAWSKVYFDSFQTQIRQLKCKQIFKVFRIDTRFEMLKYGSQEMGS